MEPREADLDPFLFSTVGRAKADLSLYLGACTFHTGLSQLSSFYTLVIVGKIIEQKTGSSRFDLAS